MKPNKKVIRAMILSLGVSSFAWAIGDQTLARMSVNTGGASGTTTSGTGAASGTSGSNATNGASIDPTGNANRSDRTSPGPTGTTSGTKSSLNDTGTGSAVPGDQSTGNSTDGSSLNGSGSTGSSSNLSGTGTGFSSSQGGNKYSPMTGTVLDSGQNFVRVRDTQGKVMNVDVPSGAMIMNGTKRGGIGDIKTGDEVTVTYGSNGQIMRVERGVNGSSTMPGGN